SGYRSQRRPRSARHCDVVRGRSNVIAAAAPVPGPALLQSQMGAARVELQRGLASRTRDHAHLVPVPGRNLHRPRDQRKVDGAVRRERKQRVDLRDSVIVAGPSPWWTRWTRRTRRRRRIGRTRRTWRRWRRGNLRPARNCANRERRYHSGKDESLHSDLHVPLAHMLVSSLVITLTEVVPQRATTLSSWRACGPADHAGDGCSGPSRAPPWTG